MSKRLAGWVTSFLMVALNIGLVTTMARATTLQSTNYRFDESSLGAGGLVQSSSSSYQASGAISDLAIGNSASANYQVESGSQTTSDPTLSFVIDNTVANFGIFSPTSAAVATASFSVSNYTSYGYVVQIAGTPFKNGSRTIPALATQTTSQTGVEQFGINLVANTSPVSIGANPDHGEFGFGTAAPNYATPNQYRFVNGETIASSPKSSGVTTYTITYLVNVAGLTEGGKYTSDQTLIVTGTY